MAAKSAAKHRLSSSLRLVRMMSARLVTMLVAVAGAQLALLIIAAIHIMDMEEAAAAELRIRAMAMPAGRGSSLF